MVTEAPTPDMDDDEEVQLLGAIQEASEVEDGDGEATEKAGENVVQKVTANEKLMDDKTTKEVVVEKVPCQEKSVLENGIEGHSIEKVTPVEDTETPVKVTAEISDKQVGAAEKSAPIIESSPAPTKEDSPAPVPSKEVSPAPRKETSSEPSKKASPEPTKETSPAPAEEASPPPVKETSPEPTKEASLAPAPVKEASPAPIKDTSPEPAGVKEPSPAPIKETVNKENTDKEKDEQSADSAVSSVDEGTDASKIAVDEETPTTTTVNGNEAPSNEKMIENETDQEKDARKADNESADKASNGDATFNADDGGSATEEKEQEPEAIPYIDEESGSNEVVESGEASAEHQTNGDVQSSDEPEEPADLTAPLDPAVEEISVAEATLGSDEASDDENDVVVDYIELEETKTKDEDELQKDDEDARTPPLQTTTQIDITVIEELKESSTEAVILEAASNNADLELAVALNEIPDIAGENVHEIVQDARDRDGKEGMLKQSSRGWCCYILFAFLIAIIAVAIALAVTHKEKLKHFFYPEEEKEESSWYFGWRKV